MEKNADFRKDVSKCDFCNAVAVTVNKHGVAVCENCKGVRKIQKRAHMRDFKNAG